MLEESGPKSGRLLCLFPLGEVGFHVTQCRLGRDLPGITKWHLDPSNRLATIHQRYRQTDGTDRTDKRDNGPSANRLQTVAEKSLSI